MSRFPCVLFLLVALGALAGPTSAGTVPADCSFLGHSGGVEPWDTNHTIDLAAGGTGRYVRHYPDNVGQPPSSPRTSR